MGLFLELVELLEITSLNGNVTLLEGQPFLHLHTTITNEQLQGFGGHLKMAIVGPTLEVVIEKLESQVQRKMDEEIGLNLFHL
jgi:predicted DNA-binding protein with PD1-like motif